jgi:hypothetical protein
MSAIPWQLFDRQHIQYIENKAKKKELKMIACGFVPFFRDDIMDVCSKCGRLVYIRPVIQDIAKRYKVPIVCMDCADKKEVATATVEALESIMKNVKSMDCRL